MKDDSEPLAQIFWRLSLRKLPFTYRNYIFLLVEEEKVLHDCGQMSSVVVFIGFRTGDYSIFVRPDHFYL